MRDGGDCGGRRHVAGARVSRPIERVMMIAPHFEEYAYRLALALAAHVEVMLVLDEGVLDAEFADRARPSHPRLMLRHSRFRTAAELARLIAQMRRFRPDVVHWQEPSGFIKAGFAAVTITLARVCTAITIHDPVPHAGRDTRVASRLARLRRYARRRAGRMFLHGPACVTQYQRDYLGTTTPDPRVRLTEHGVVLQGPPIPPPAQFRAVMIGRMEAYKGLETLVRALERLADDGRPVAVHVAGAGPEIERLHDRLVALPGVTVAIGFVSAAELIALVAQSTAVLLPYTDASQSGVLATAFANGRLVIASAVGGIVDLVTDGANGLLVPPGDAMALADAITRVAQDPALQATLCDGARRTAAERLDWDLIAARMLADY